MELVIRGTKRKKVEVKKGVITIQSKEEDLILDNLSEDYELRIVDNRDLFFIGLDLLTEIFNYNETPDIEFVNEVMYVMEYEASFLNKEIKDMSITEKIMVNLFRQISFNQEIIVFKNIFNGIDLKVEKRMSKLFKYLVEKKHIVILFSDDVNKLYQYGDYSYIGNKVSSKFNKTDDIYSDVESLIKYKLEIPTLSYITYKAKKDKNVKLFYSKDVRDVIKDVYKHV